MRWLDYTSVGGPKAIPWESRDADSSLWRQLRQKARPLRSGYHQARERLATLVLRARLGQGVSPFVDRWFARGKPVHRYYLEQFLAQHASDIRGHCLEFQEDSYTTRFGGQQVTRLDILHKERDERATQATLYADLTHDNTIPSGSFDCIICTYVLHVIDEPRVFVDQLYRLLRGDGGVLLMAVPTITVWYTEYPELWRFTPLGLERLLERSFGTGAVQVRSYGNSLTCAGEIRGLAELDFSRNELDFHDPRFGLVACARAVKGKVD